MQEIFYPTFLLYCAPFEELYVQEIFYPKFLLYCAPFEEFFESYIPDIFMPKMGIFGRLGNLNVNFTVFTSAFMRIDLF